MTSAALSVPTYDLDGASVAEPHGVLDAATYRALRDTLVKLGVEEPRAVIVDLADLAVPDRSALALFVSVSDQLAQWPGVQVLLVAGRAVHRQLLGRSCLGRFVPVFTSVPAAQAATDDPPIRRIARRTLPNQLISARLARRFVAETCAEWGEKARVDDALLVVDTLVNNTLIHTYCAPTIRVELRRGRLTIAVVLLHVGDPKIGGDLGGGVGAAPECETVRRVLPHCCGRAVVRAVTEFALVAAIQVWV